jgi:omega-6 fatty acid desaturase (delta-12 desaturase)
MINNVGIVFMIKYINDIGILREYFVALYFSSVLISIIIHNQHTFNPSYVVGNNAWTLKESSIMGSSFIIIPPNLNFLKFFTNGFEYHHIHHLNPRIPGYNLEKYHNYMVEHNILDVSNIWGLNPPCKLTFEDCFYNCWLFLYDTERGIYM